MQTVTIINRWSALIALRCPPHMKFDDDGHILITPREMEERAFAAPDWLINHALLPGTPLAFPRYSNYAEFVDFLASKTGIHPHHFLFRGSTKIGFSICPNRDKRRVWRRFGPASDLDLAITDPHFYATVDEEVRRYDRHPRNLEKVLRYRTGSVLNKYRNRINQKGRHDCYRYFDLPRELDCLKALDDVLREAPLAKCCIHPFAEFKAFIFRDRWSVHRRYHTDLEDLRRGLTAKENPLPKAGEEPSPPEAMI
jgi:hypothetical protein